MKILVVDDDSLAGAMTSAILEAFGHEPVFVENGVEAMETLSENHRLEMIISDMNMPLISGLDLFKTIREEGVTLPFILLTGDDPAPLLEKEPDLDACVMKDADLEEVLPKVIQEIM